MSSDIFVNLTELPGCVLYTWNFAGLWYWWGVTPPSPAAAARKRAKFVLYFAGDAVAAARAAGYTSPRAAAQRLMARKDVRRALSRPGRVALDPAVVETPPECELVTLVTRDELLALEATWLRDKTLSIETRLKVAAQLSRQCGWDQPAEVKVSLGDTLEGLILAAAERRVETEVLPGLQRVERKEEPAALPESRVDTDTLEGLDL